MPKLKDSEPKILLDADVIIHFVKAGFQMKLNLIFPGRLVILDKVQQELCKRKSESLAVDNIIHWNKIQVIPMPADLNIIKEYATLRKTRGEGESACMAEPDSLIDILPVAT